MSLDVAKLEKARELAGGIVQARCPACAEGGGDRKGEHLRVYPDGRYGCCVHPKDGEHRKRIFALAGVRGKLPFPSSGTFTLRIKTPPALPAAQSVRAVLTAPSSRTVRTPFRDSENGVPSVPAPPADDIRTGRTGISKSRAYAREEAPNVRTPVYTCKDSESAVLPVLTDSAAGTLLPPTVAGAPCGGPALPYLTPGGTLVIPFDSPERYHWWKPPHEQRLRVKEIMAEVLAARGR
jgi:hypothetical protein